MAENHYLTKRHRRPVSGRRRDCMRETMAKLRELEAAEKLEALPDEQIDTSDIPEVTDWTKAEVGKFYRKPE